MLFKTILPATAFALASGAALAAPRAEAAQVAFDPSPPLNSNLRFVGDHSLALTMQDNP